MKKQDYSFKKKERLSHQKTIDRLFSSGKSFVIFPFRIVYMPNPMSKNDPLITQILVSVSKKRFKSAVKRNRIKRLIREAYRTNKHLLNNIQSRSHHPSLIAFIYIDTKIHPFSLIQKKIREALHKINPPS